MYTFLCVYYYRMISLHLGHPRMRKIVWEKHPSLYKELNKTIIRTGSNMMIQRKTLPTVRKQPKWEDPHLQDNNAI